MRGILEDYRIDMHDEYNKNSIERSLRYEAFPVTWSRIINKDFFRGNIEDEEEQDLLTDDVNAILIKHDMPFRLYTLFDMFPLDSVTKTGRRIKKRRVQVTDYALDYISRNVLTRLDFDEDSEDDEDDTDDE